MAAWLGDIRVAAVQTILETIPWHAADLCWPIDAVIASRWTAPGKSLATEIMMLPNLGPTEVLVLLAIGLLLFGKRLPELGRSIGKALVEFKRGLRDAESS